MKKTVLAVLAALISGTAGAQVTALTSGPNNYRMDQCALLANDIQLNLSNNVIGAVNCNADDVTVAISFCHTSGLVAQRTVPVTRDINGEVVCTVTADENCVETVTGATHPSASTDDGTVTQVFPGQNCTAASVAAVANSYAPQPEDDDTP